MSGQDRQRARGRARSVDPNAGAPNPPGRGQQQQGAWGPRPGGAAPRGGRGGPRAEGVWGPRPTGPTPQSAMQRAPAPMTGPGQPGRATTRETHTRPVEDPAIQVVGAGGDDAGNSTAGRGSVRGKRQLGYETATLLTRPAHAGMKQGISGKPIKLTANYFELQTRTDWCLYQYRVDFSPDIDVTSIRKKVLGQAAKDKLPGFMFDGTMIFTSRRISPDPMELFSKSESGEAIRMTIRLVGDVAQGDYHLIQFFNIILRKCLVFMKLQLVGRNFYDPKARINVAEYGIELWPGYVTSIRQHENKILLCCEISHKFMRNENVLNVLKTHLQADRSNYKKSFQQHVVGCVVLTDYNNRTYRVDDVDWSVTPKSTFNRSDGTSISYIQYYRERYNLKISDDGQPMLVSRAKQRELRAGMAEIIYLVPELCRMTGITDAERNDFYMMRKLAEFTRLGPDARQQRLCTYSQRMNNTKEIVHELEKWDMKLSPRLVEFNARVLAPEYIVQGPQLKYQYGDDCEWTKNLRSNPMLVLPKIDSWVVVVASHLKREALDFVNALEKAARGMRMMLPKSKCVDISDDRPSSYLGGLDTAISLNPNFILCCVSNNKADRYAAIKKKCYVDKAIPTQVIVKKNMVSKGMMSIATKVAIQINCKLGGAPWTVELPLKGLMVVGFDVCHDTTNKSKSFGAMVASLDQQVTRYFSAVSQHSSGEELCNDFALNILKSVRRYQEIHKALPEKILIYRDGVGEGQLPYVHGHEVTRIEQELKKFYGEKPLKMAFIVVTKRINTRVFRGNMNPPPGTVIDDVITLPHRYDFFIVSQCVRQGTVAPTSYNVIYDTLGLDVDKMQRLTYKFTHMYFNWSGTVRVPAPCQYAHKLAFLVSQSLHRAPNSNLDSTLYFL